MSLIALTQFLILRKPRSGCLEERTALIQPVGCDIRQFTQRVPRCVNWRMSQPTGWINAVRSSRQPLRGFLRMRNWVNAINDIPHADERPTGASRSTRDFDAGLPSEHCP